MNSQPSFSSSSSSSLSLFSDHRESFNRYDPGSVHEINRRTLLPDLKSSSLSPRSRSGKKRSCSTESSNTDTADDRQQHSPMVEAPTPTTASRVLQPQGEAIQPLMPVVVAPPHQHIDYNLNLLQFYTSQQQQQQHLNEQQQQQQQQHLQEQQLLRQQQRQQQQQQQYYQQEIITSVAAGSTSSSMMYPEEHKLQPHHMGLSAAATTTPSSQQLQPAAHPLGHLLLEPRTIEEMIIDPNQQQQKEDDETTSKDHKHDYLPHFSQHKKGYR
jgi:hypothetical protein